MAQTNRIPTTTDPAVDTKIAAAVDPLSVRITQVDVENDAKADSVDTLDYPLTLVAGSTTFVHNRYKPNKEVTVNVSTTLTPLPPADGWRQNDSGQIVLKFDGSPSVLDFAGGTPVGYPGTAAQMANGKEAVAEYYSRRGAIRWSIEYLTPAAAALRRYFAKGDGIDAHISIASHTTDVTPVPLKNQDTGDVTFELVFRVPAATGAIQVLVEKGAGSVGTAQFTISSTGILRWGMKNTAAYYADTAVSVADGLRHRAVFTYQPAIATLKGWLDGDLIDTRTAVPAAVYNTAPYSLLSRASGTLIPANGDIFIFRMHNRILSDAEIVGLSGGESPRTGLQMEYLFLSGNANDTSVNVYHGVSSRGITFGNELI